MAGALRSTVSLAASAACSAERSVGLLARARSIHGSTRAGSGIFGGMLAEFIERPGYSWPADDTQASRASSSVFSAVISCATVRSWRACASCIVDDGDQTHVKAPPGLFQFAGDGVLSARAKRRLSSKASTVK